jgi:hypothetical protein
MQRLAPWLLAVLVLVGALLALVGLGLVAFWQGPLAACFAALGGLAVLWAVLDRSPSRRPSN